MAVSSLFPMKVWFLTNTPSPYQGEFLTALSKSGRLDLSVRFMSLTHRGERWTPPSGEQLDFKEIRPRVLCSGVIRDELVAGGYDAAVLSGQYTRAPFVLAARESVRLKMPWLAWLERPWPEDYRPRWSRRWSSRLPLVGRVRNGILRRLLKSCAGVLCIGTVAKEAYASLGVPEDRLTILSYICDINRFRKVSPAIVNNVRKQYKLEDRLTFLFSGALTRRKGVDILISAFARLGAGQQDVSLMIIGDGPEREALRRSVPEHVRSRVHFAGMIPQSLLPAFYGAADVFVFPSRYDGWGVVLNEACAAGLPIIAADSAGAAHDLVREGRNGFLAGRDDVDGMLKAMSSFVGNRGMVGAFGAESRKLVEKFSIAGGIDIFCRAVEGAARR